VPRYKKSATLLLGTATVVGAIFTVLSFFQKEGTDLVVNNSPASINTINQVGDNIINNNMDPTLIADLNALQPRILSAEQRSALITQISKHKGRIGFYSKFMDGESADFVDSLSSAFVDAGWQVFPVNRSSTNDYPGYVNLFVTGERQRIAANFVCNALTNISIDCRAEKMEEATMAGTRELDAIYVVVGRKR